MGLQAFDESVAFANALNFVAATGLGQQGFTVPLSSASRIDVLSAVNGDSIDHVVDIFYTTATLSALLGSKNVPAGSGYAGAPPVDLLSGLVPSLQEGILLPVGCGLAAAVEVALTGTTELDLLAIGGQV